MIVKILHQNCDPTLAEDRTLPYNTYIVKYMEGKDEICYDIVISDKKVEMFDYYWDKYREGLLNWKQTEGRVNPKTWNNSPKKKK